MGINCAFWGAFDARLLGTFAIARDILNAPFLLFGMTFAPQKLPLLLHTINYSTTIACKIQ